ncbi:MAG: hypothetical protein ACO23V_11590, partial [Chitinophagaceae bacterium]
MFRKLAFLLVFSLASQLYANTKTLNTKIITGQLIDAKTKRSTDEVDLVLVSLSSGKRFVTR